MTIGKANGLPRSSTRRSVGDKVQEQLKLDNQFLLQGTDPTFPQGFPNTEDVIVFLEYVQASTTYTIEGAVVGVLTGSLASTIPLDLTHSPLRLDGGVKLNGTILMAKGFWLPVK